MYRFTKSRLFAWLTLFVLLLGSGTVVLAQTIVEPLPENNLVENPWFRQGNQPSLAGWTDAAGNNTIWSTSQKQSNPSPDQVMGTSARMAFGSGQGGGIGQGGVDAYLYQVVSADPAMRHLQFKIHWVTVWIDRATVTLYGGDTADGPWTAVWVPLDVSQATSSSGAWTQTELLDTTIAEGYSFYKIELFTRYPEDRQQGAKFTGVFFTVDDNEGEVVEAAPDLAGTQAALQPDPTTRPVRQTAVPPTNTPTSTAAPVDDTADEETQPTATAVAVVSTPEPEPTQPAAQPTRAPDVVSAPANDSISPIYMIVIGVLLLLVIVLGIGWARAARR